MATKDEVKAALLERMKDPTISATVFDELQRRLALLDNEE